MTSNTTSVLISVVIPVYKRPDALKRTLESVIDQTHTNIEILVIDDGSEIELFPVIEELNDARISYFKLEHNNANVARNYGIVHSKGQYIAMLDADDLWLNNHLESCYNELIESNFDGLYGSLILRNTVTKQERVVAARALHEGETMIDYLLRSGYGAQSSTLFFTAKSIKDILWDPTLKRHQDYDLVVRYNKKYQLTAKVKPTVIYTFGESKQSEIDFKSCIKVIKDNENDVSPGIYNSYNQNMLSLANYQKASQDIIDYYKKEATYYKEFISFYQYLKIMLPQTRYEKIICRFMYLYYILKMKIE